MKINLKKLDDKIAKLQELRRLANDPALADFIEVIGGKSSSNGSPSHADISSTNGHGQLRDNVLAACKSFLLNTFTLKDVYRAMTAQGTEAGVEKSIGNTLRLLAHEGAIRIATPGKGRRATEYHNV